MQLPREVIVGHGTLSAVGEVCRDLGFSGHALVVTGPKVYELGYKGVSNSLSEKGFKVSVEVVEDSSLEWVKTVEDKCEESSPSLVVGLGGGKDIDTAKLAAANKRIPYISVPTAASHDGIASPYASMKGADKPYSIKAQAPVAIIADTDVIARSPYKLVASGCGDIIAKYTAVKDWRLAHKLKNEYYGDYAANLALMSAKLVMRNAQIIRSNSPDGVRTVVEALISCGVAISIAGSTRPCSGSEHLFSHALDLIQPGTSLHGERCGVGTIMCAYLHGSNWKLIRRVLQKIGAPTTSNELQVTPSQITQALIMAHKIRPERYTILGETGLTIDAAEKLAKVTGVI